MFISPTLKRVSPISSSRFFFDFFHRTLDALDARTCVRKRPQFRLMVKVGREIWQNSHCPNSTLTSLTILDFIFDYFKLLKTTCANSSKYALRPKQCISYNYLNIIVDGFKLPIGKNSSNS